MHSSSSDFVFNFTDESHFFLQLIFPKRGNIKTSIKYFLLVRRSLSTLTVHHTLRRWSCLSLLMASGENKTPKDLAWFVKFKHCFFHFLVFEVLKIRLHEKKSLFELIEKVLRSSFKIIFGVRTARVFKLKKNLPYRKETLIIS